MKNFKPILASLLLTTGIFTITSETLGDRNAISYARRAIQNPFIPEDHRLYLLAQAANDAKSDTAKAEIKSIASTFAAVPSSIFDTLNQRIKDERRYVANNKSDARFC